MRWADATGVEQRIARDRARSQSQSAALALPLTVARASRHTGPVDGRHAAIPRDAIDLGDGRSLFKPAPRRHPRLAVRQPECAHRRALQRARSRWRRRSSRHRPLRLHRRRPGCCLPGGCGSPPEPAATRCAPRSRCSSRTAVPPRPTASAKPSGWSISARRGAAPVSRSAPQRRRPTTGSPGWREIGDRFVRYHCAVRRRSGRPADAARTGTGRLSFTPIGWTIGHGAGTLPRLSPFGRQRRQRRDRPRRRGARDPARASTRRWSNRTT